MPKKAENWTQGVQTGAQCSRAQQRNTAPLVFASSFEGNSSDSGKIQFYVRIRKIYLSNIPLAFYRSVISFSLITQNLSGFRPALGGLMAIIGQPWNTQADFFWKIFKLSFHKFTD